MNSNTHGTNSRRFISQYIISHSFLWFITLVQNRHMKFLKNYLADVQKSGGRKRSRWYTRGIVAGSLFSLSTTNFWSSLTDAQFKNCFIWFDPAFYPKPATNYLYKMDVSRSISIKSSRTLILKNIRLAVLIAVVFIKKKACIYVMTWLRSDL